MSVRLAHVADLQLGFNRFDGRPSRRREQDFYRVWHETCQDIVDQDVELVVIAGDIYEYSSPSAAAQVAFIDGLSILRDADIPTVITSGNHETPRTQVTEHPLRVIQQLASSWDLDLFVVLDEPTNIHDVVWVIPWNWHRELSKEDFNTAPSEAYICVLHAAASTIPEYERGRRRYDPEWGEQFRYVALGDFHKPVEVAPNQWYSGALERTSFGDRDAKTGWLRVDMSKSSVKIRHCPSKARSMIDLVFRSTEDFEEWSMEASYACEAMYRITMEGIDPIQIDQNIIRNVQSELPFVKTRYTDRPLPISESLEFGPKPIIEQWRLYTDDADLESDVCEAGITVLEEAMES